MTNKGTMRGPSAWGSSSSSGSSAPANAPFVTTASDATLSNETVIGSIILPPDTFANRPSAAGLVAGTMFWSTDTGVVYRANGSGAWVTAMSAWMANDPLWDAAGDLPVGTGPDTGTRLPVGTEAGQTPTADPSAANKLAWGSAFSLEARFRGTTGSLASTYDRATVAEGNSSAIVSGRLTVVRILLPKGLTITSITFWSMTTALNGGQNQWFVLCDSSRVPLRFTNDDTSTAWGANTAKTLNLTSSYQTTYTGWHYLGIMVKASSAVPTIAAGINLGNVNYRNAAPIPSASSSTGLTDPASCPNPIGALTSLGAMPYAEVS